MQRDAGTWRHMGCGDMWAGDTGTSNIGDAGGKGGSKCDISLNPDN